MLIHDQFNESGTLTSSTTPAATKFAKFVLTLSSGTATIDLTSVTGTNGALISGSDDRHGAVSGEEYADDDSPD